MQQLASNLELLNWLVFYRLLIFIFCNMLLISY